MALLSSAVHVVRQSARKSLSTSSETVILVKALQDDTSSYSYMHLSFDAMRDLARALAEVYNLYEASSTEWNSPT